MLEVVKISICVGCGLEVVAGILQVDVDGTTIGCGANGIFAIAPFPGISTDACNGTKLGTDGKVWSPCPEGIAFIDTNNSPQIGTIPLATVGPNGTYDFESVIVSITNTSACCTVSGIMSFMSGFTGTIDAASKLTAEMAAQEDGGAYVNASPASYEIFQNLHATDPLAWASNLYDQIWSTWAPGQVKTFRARTRFTQVTGAGDVLTGGVFELQWTLVPTSCGC